LNKKKIKEK